MSDLSIAVQTAIFTTLKNGLTAGVKVYDAVPQKSSYPYVVIDNMTALEMDALVESRDDRFMYLSIWSQYKGQKEVLGIISEIVALLHRKKLSMSEGKMIDCFCASRQTMRDADNMTFQGAVKLRIRTEQ